MIPSALCATTHCRTPVPARGALCFYCDRAVRWAEAKRKRSEAAQARAAARRASLPIVEDKRTGHVDHGAPGYACVASPEPCPRTDCRHHLDAGATCSIREANRGPMTLAEIGELLGITRERIRQLEVAALRKLRRSRSPAARALLAALED
jgi:hypothetical protein